MEVLKVVKTIGKAHSVARNIGGCRREVSSGAGVKSQSVTDECRRSLFKSCKETRLARRAGVSVIIELVNAYSTPDETAVHAITLFDRFLISRRQHSTPIDEELESFAVSCFLIAMKYREPSSPCLIDLEQLTSGRCSTARIATCETVVLTNLEWDLHVSAAFDIAMALLRMAGIDAHQSLLQSLNFLLLLAYYRCDLLECSDVDIAAAAIILANRAAGKRSADAGNNAAPDSAVLRAAAALGARRPLDCAARLRAASEHVARPPSAAAAAAANPAAAAEGPGCAAAAASPEQC